MGALFIGLLKNERLVLTSLSFFYSDSLQNYLVVTRSRVEGRMPRIRIGAVAIRVRMVIEVRSRLIFRPARLSNPGKALIRNRMARTMPRFRPQLFCFQTP